MSYRNLTDMETAKLLASENSGAWNWALTELIAQIKKSRRYNQECADWNTNPVSLMARLYEEMVGKKRLENYNGKGSLIGWLKRYATGYLSRENPADPRKPRQLSLDAQNGSDSESGDLLPPFIERVSYILSENRGNDAYVDTDLSVLKHEALRIGQKCFSKLWKESPMQGYVMLLKTRFELSSAEICVRLHASSAANVDQMFHRAVKRMQELKVQYVA